MTDHNYPHNGYGVETYTAETGWVLLDGIYRTCVAATKARQDLTGRYGLEAGDLRVVALTITRKGDTE